MGKGDGVLIGIEAGENPDWVHAGKTVVSKERRIQLTQESREVRLVPVGERGFWGFERPTTRMVISNGEPIGSAVESVDSTRHVGPSDNHRLTVPFQFFERDGNNLNTEAQRAGVPADAKLEVGTGVHFLYPDTGGPVEWAYLLTDDQLTGSLDISVCGTIDNTPINSRVTESARSGDHDRE